MQGLGRSTNRHLALRYFGRCRFRQAENICIRNQPYLDQPQIQRAATRGSLPESYFLHKHTDLIQLLVITVSPEHHCFHILRHLTTSWYSSRQTYNWQQLAFPSQISDASAEESSSFKIKSHNWFKLQPYTTTIPSNCIKFPRVAQSFNTSALQHGYTKQDSSHSRGHWHCQIQPTKFWNSSQNLRASPREPRCNFHPSASPSLSTLQHWLLFRNTISSSKYPASTIISPTTSSHSMVSEPQLQW